MPGPKYERLADAIRAQIATGDLNPGDRLPSTAQLCARYHIGHDTVTRAMDILVRDHVIVTHRGQARYVWPGPPDPFEKP